MTRAWKALETTFTDHVAVDMCDICKREIKHIDDSEVRLEAFLGEVYLEGDARDHLKLDCCVACFKDTVRPLLESQLSVEFTERRSEHVDTDYFQKAEIARLRYELQEARNLVVMELQAEAQREECSNHLEDQFKPGDEVWATAFCGGTVQRIPATVKGYTAVGLLVVTDSGLMFAYRKDGSSLTAICTAPLQMRGSTATDIAIEIQNVLSDSRIDEVSRG